MYKFVYFRSNLAFEKVVVVEFRYKISSENNEKILISFHICQIQKLVHLTS